MVNAESIWFQCLPLLHDLPGSVHLRALYEFCVYWSSVYSVLWSDYELDAYIIRILILFMKIGQFVKCIVSVCTFSFLLMTILVRTMGLRHLMVLGTRNISYYQQSSQANEVYSARTARESTQNDNDQSDCFTPVYFNSYTSRTSHMNVDSVVNIFSHTSKHHLQQYNEDNNILVGIITRKDIQRGFNYIHWFLESINWLSFIILWVLWFWMSML